MKTNLQELLKTVLERGLSIATYIFPFLEITVYFSSRVCYSSNDIGLKIIYQNYLFPLMVFYEKNVYLIFIGMVGIFLMCSRTSLPLTKFLRFKHKNPIAGIRRETNSALVSAHVDLMMLCRAMVDVVSQQVLLQNKKT